MADERELIAERERKVAELRAAGRNPYANGWQPTHLAADVLARFRRRSPRQPPPRRARPPTAPRGPEAEPAMLSDDRFAIAGRIVAHRGFGKATFVKVADRSGEVQVYIKKDTIGEPEYDLFRKTRAGRLHRRCGAPPSSPARVS